MDPGILHIDMDAFYASVEVRDHPELEGKPVIVGGRPGSRGVVSAASYEAREYGVRSAMPLVRAARLCPAGVFRRVNMDRYVEVSEDIFAIFKEYTPLVQGLSLDEAFLDVRGSARLFGSGEEIGREIKARIRDELSLPCSVGVATVKFVAKIASDFDKPDGFVVVREEDLLDFLGKLGIERLWGVGEVTAERLRHFGLTTVGEIRSAGEELLTERLGEIGTHLHNLSLGIDPRPVRPDWDRKSVGHETTFPEDIGDREVLLSVVLDLAEEVARRARKGGHRGRTVVLKVRYAPFETHTVRVSLLAITSATDEIYRAAKELFHKSVAKDERKVRLLGVTLTGLAETGTRQLSLFGEAVRERSRRVDATVDTILEKMGRGAIRRAGGANPKRRKRPKADPRGDR